jgi:hypothetical protein
MGELDGGSPTAVMLPDCERSQGMDGIRELLDAVRDHGLIKGRFRGLLHIGIGRKVTKPDGSLLSAGLTWRELATVLKELRFDRDLAREFGADPSTLAPRDRERFWYSAIVQAHVNSPEASAEADALAAELKRLGFIVGPNPTAIAASPGKKPEPKAKTREDKPGKGKKK